MEFDRTIDLPALLARKSFFLFGPRSTGKTTAIRQQLPEVRVYDLLKASDLTRLGARPELLSEENESGTIVSIDEIQKLPSLLDEVHRAIENRKLTFLLTGSSARKLRRGGTNLLAGRAWEAHLFPLTWAEIPGFDLLRYINRGGLPQVYKAPAEDVREELKSYVQLYLQQEVQAEALTRNLGSFSRFLTTMALNNGEELNFTGLASDCGVPVSTLKGYLEILDDTLVGFSVPAFRKTSKRKAIARSKYYLFDVGVTGNLAGRGKVRYPSDLFGRAFEHFIAMELRAYLSYRRRDERLMYWRSTSQFEVDFVVGRELAIEVKGTSLVQDKHLKGLRAFAEEGLVRRSTVVSMDARPRRTADGIEVLPWKVFLEQLWGDEMW